MKLLFKSWISKRKFEYFIHFILEQVSVLMSGGAIGFYSGDVHWLTDDMKLLKPTFVPTVPKFFNRLYSKVSN